MMRALAGISFIVLLSGAAVCQSGANKPAFDIADIHVSPRSDWVKDPTHPMQGGFLSADRYELRRATMLDLIRIAYNVDADKVYGGPSWLDYDRFEVVARTKRGTRPETLRLMLQTLIEDRFQVVVKMDTRPVPGYVLSKGKRELKLKAATDTSNTAGCQTLRPTVGAGIAYQNIQCRNVTMDAFAPTLRRLVSGPLRNLPVVDSTGLEGGWDIDLQIAARSALSDGAADAGVVEAVDKLGLKLELGKVPQPVLVVENANEQPSANPPGVAASLPPLPPPEFEVASIKWPCNDNITMSLRFEAGGRVTATCVSLLILIKQAWNLANFEQPVGVPKWLGDNSTGHNISIVAKAPVGVAPDPQNNAQARDTLHMMLRALLIDRYKMTVHYEDRPMDADTLVAVKPKLTKADPANRTGCTRHNQQQQGRALLVRLVCQNMTMAQFAEQIPAYDSDIYYPVLDGTGISGAWDFTLNYDAMATLNARFPLFGGGAAANPNGEASDPSGSISFVNAIEKQLGLKLEVHKRPEPVLVIDHIEEKPTEN
ncbi:MAG: TIGR03435 family protein [Bryobacteraceae bacterium]|jgi:uncharacterized protein (TIGR03435 family)